MNSTQIKCLVVFSVFALIGFGPISLGCLIGMYVLLKKPSWFWTLAGHLYKGLNIPNYSTQLSIKQSNRTRYLCFASIVFLFIIDIAPVPVTPVVAFYIILLRPIWFIHLVAKIYAH